VSYDPVALEIAQIVGRPYGDARLALRWLENRGWTTNQAREFLLKEWALGMSLEQMAHKAAP
jgi:hypothetical protein